MPKEKEDIEINALERSMSNTDKALEGQADEDGGNVLREIRDKREIEERVGAPIFELHGTKAAI